MIDQMIFIDSNIWCYYFDARLPEHAQVSNSVRSAIRDSIIAVNTVVVMEVAHYITRNLDQDEARRRLDIFVNLRNLLIIDFDRSLMRASIDFLTRYSRAHGLGGRDSTIIASLMDRGIKTLMTHDLSLSLIASELEVETIDPVKLDHT